MLRFRDAIASGDRNSAIRLYSGDLLPACFDDWVLEEREKLRGEVLKALSQLLADAASRGDHKNAIEYARQIRDLEPTDVRLR